MARDSPGCRARTAPAGQLRECRRHGARPKPRCDWTTRRIRGEHQRKMVRCAKERRGILCDHGSSALLWRVLRRLVFSSVGSARRHYGGWTTFSFSCRPHEKRRPFRAGWNSPLLSLRRHTHTHHSPGRSRRRKAARPVSSIGPPRSPCASPGDSVHAGADLPAMGFSFRKM